MSVVKLKSGDNLGYLVEQYDKTLIQFSADWCGPCRRVTPVVKEKLQELNDPRVGYVYIDIDEHERIAKAFQISTIPHFIIYDKKTDTITLPYKGSDTNGLVSYCNKSGIGFK
mgnify:CR=1 FL=1